MRFSSIPHKSIGLAPRDLLAGQIDSVIDQIPASLGHVRSGKLRPIAATSRRRSTQLPDVPTLDEAGVSGFDAQTPLVLMAPAGTTEAVVRSSTRPSTMYWPIRRSRRASRNWAMRSRP